MRFASIVLAAGISAALAAPAAAQETGSFVVRLGRDTTGVERYTRSGGKTEIEQVGRAPRVLRRQIGFQYDDHGMITSASAMITSPGANGMATPVQQITIGWQGDSLAYESRRDTVVQRLKLAAPKNLVIANVSTPWVTYESLGMALARQSADSLHRPLYFMGSNRLTWVTVRKLGRDSIVIENETDRFHAQVDSKGRIQHLVPLRGTSQYTVDRVPGLDVPAYMASFAAREQQSGAMGVLSPRDTVRASIGGATLWIDYGRPSRRGRTIFGGVVPWGETWRTGANAATQFKTDKPLAIGGKLVPAGMYTLWTIPSPGNWKLVINSQTGQWGTEHKPEMDLFTLDLSTQTLPEPVEKFTIAIVPNERGGAIQLDWDTTRASIPFAIQP